MARDFAGPSRLDIAIVGSGITGLSAAWLLSNRHRVTLYESEPRLGGHSHTVDIETPDGLCAVDTGFIVYNLRTYPNLIALFDHLGVPTAPSSMTFSVSLDRGACEYSGNGLIGLLGGISNVASLSHWRMVASIFRFFREARKAVGTVSAELSFGDWLGQHRFDRGFVDRHILPMAAAIWSAAPAEMLAFPAAAFLRFFSHHGLLQVFDRPQWRTVQGGSRSYVSRLAAALPPDAVRVAHAVTAVARGPRGVTVTDATGARAQFDHVVLACHADQALRLLDEPDSNEQELLGAFRYSRNDVILHTDASAMPRRRRLWSSWNYLGSGVADERRLSVTYWMNNLQPLNTKQDVFVTLNPITPIAPAQVHRQFVYEHPIFDRAAMQAQGELWRLQARRRTWFCGSYFGYGFHEDGLQSGLAVAEELGRVRRPWSVADESGRVLARRVPALGSEGVT